MEMVTEVNFTPKARRIIEVARQKCLTNNALEVTDEFLLFAVLRSESSVVSSCFKAMSVDANELSGVLEKELFCGKSPPKAEPALSQSSSAIIDYSTKISSEMGAQYTGVEHVLLSMIGLKSGAIKFLEGRGIKIDELESNIRGECKIITKPQLTDSGQKSPSKNEQSSAPTLLSKYSTNYSERAANGEFDSISHRDTEVARLAEILCRKTKRNAVIIGESGVGKSSLVGLLAREINRNKTTEFLMGRVIYGIDLPSLVAGTKYRGDFEERITKILEEAKADPKVIIFIDEIHAVLGAGNQEGGLDVCNVLKPYLSSGEISVIGATTDREYRNFFKRDPALNRRFESVNLKEPSAKETEAILQKIKGFYENFHRVRFSDEVIKDIIFLAEKYMPEKRFPDKAIDILDQTGAKVKIKRFARPKKLVEVQDRLERLISSEEQDPSGDERTRLTEEFKEGINNWLKKTASKKATANSSDVYEVVSQKVGSVIEYKTRGTTSNLRENLGARVIGQEAAIKAVSDCVLRASYGLSDRDKPMGAFLLTGPTGCGKTLLAQELASLAFGSPERLLRMDMSEYMESHSVSRLTGAPPGYVGFHEGSLLSRHMSVHPSSVILFDEVEKAHPDVLNLLLQILDSGKMTVANGSSISFKNTIIIGTSNLGFQKWDGFSKVGFVNPEPSSVEISSGVMDSVKKTFRPELLGRLNKVIVLERLSDEALLKIVGLELAKVCSGLSENGIKIKFDGLVAQTILQKHKKLNPEKGGRGIVRIIEEEVKSKIVDSLASSEYDSVTVSVENGDLEINGKKSTILLGRKQNNLSNRE